MATSELILGYEEGYVGNPRGFLRDEATKYIDKKDSYQPDVPYLNGLWKITRQYAEHARSDAGDYLMVSFEGEKASILVEKENGESTIGVVLDDERVGDITASSLASINLPLPLAQNRRLLKLEVSDPGVRIYTLAFGALAD